MRTAERGDGSRAPFDPLIMLFHWLTVVLLAVLGLSGIAAVHFEGEPFAASLLLAHRSTGAVVWTLTVLRFFWRASFARFPAFPETMPRFQRWLVIKSEQILYASLFTQPLSGFAMTIALGRPFELFVWTVPALVPRNIELHLLLMKAHIAGSVALYSLAGGHALMGLVHHYLLKDDVLATMAPWVKERRAKRLIGSPAVGEG